jgi:hypothetical protein
MAFEQRKKTPSLLPRDKNNRVIKSEVQSTVETITKRLLTAERDIQKDITFAKARGSKRDICIFITVVQRNSIDGNICLEDTKDPKFERWSPRDPYSYKVFDSVDAPIVCKHLPLKHETAFKQLQGCMSAVLKYLMQMGAVQ